MNARRQAPRTASQAPSPRPVPEPHEQAPGAAWGNAALAEQIAQEGAEGTLSALPYRSALEEAFGTDLSFVRARLGADEACTALGARAYAQESDVVFREERPALETVAHEVTHVLQQTGAQQTSSEGTAGTAGTALTAASAERDADRAASLVGQGREASVGGRASTGIYRDPEVLTGNPQLGTPDAGATRSYRPRQADADEAGTGNAGESRPATVRLIHDESHPQTVPVGAVPTPVYAEETPGLAVSGFHGTMASPMVSMHAVDSPFLGDTPSPDDVHQGSIGDCWLLSAVLNAVRDNPEQVREMFVGWSANSVTVRLFRRDAGTGAHVPVLVTVGRETLIESRPGQAEPDQVGATPGDHRQVDSQWYARVNAAQLEVHRRDRYEIASWPVYLERAYARFVEAHGQYGGAQLPPGVSPHPNRAANGSVRSGYDVLDDGGWSAPVGEVLFGDRAAAPTANLNTNFTAGGDLVRTNRAAISALARGNHATGSASVDLVASIDNDTLRARAALSLDQVLAEPWLARSPALRNEFTYLRNLLRQRPNVAAARRAAYDQEIQNAAGHATRGGAWPLLDGARAPASATALRELLVDLQNSGESDLRDQRMMYSDHAYQVVRSTFRDGTGAELTVDPGALDASLPRIDGQRSVVRVRNPHGTNEPNGTRGALPSGADDGQFDLTLEQFLRHTGTLEISEHTNTAPGTCG